MTGELVAELLDQDRLRLHLGQKPGREGPQVLGVFGQRSGLVQHGHSLPRRDLAAAVGEPLGVGITPRAPQQPGQRLGGVVANGLTNRAGARGRRRKLTAAQEATFAAWVREGPKPDMHKVVRWRCRDLQGEIARHFGVEMHERTVGKLLARLNFSRVSVRPRHPEQDIAAQEAHKKTSPSWSPRPFPSMLGASRSSCGGRMKHASASREA